MAHQAVAGGFPFAVFINEAQTAQRIAPSIFVDEAAGGPITGSFAMGLGGLTAGAAGGVTAAGSLSAYLSGLGVGATGAIPVHGSAAAGLGSLGGSRAGSLAVTGTLSQALGAVVLAADMPVRTGGLNLALDATGLLATGDARFTYAGKTAQLGLVFTGETAAYTGNLALQFDTGLVLAFSADMALAVTYGGVVGATAARQG